MQDSRSTDSILVPKGFRFAGVRCGLKNKRNDLGLIVSDIPARVAGVFTQSTVRAACVDFSRDAVSAGVGRLLVVNSGNANCCTGEQGERDTAQMANLVRVALNMPDEPVAVASTGIIGHLLDMSKVERGIFSASNALGVEIRPFMDAILTTDLVEKVAFTTVSGATVTGVAKGSGMINPNMATMLGFVVTDLDASAVDLSAVWKRVCDRTFNRVTVDGDTSTNDMAIVFANGASGASVSEAELEAALTEVCDSLARQIARDGEGATKLIEVRVTGSASPREVAESIANSPLVKTAMFGCDPNWGRVLMAAGKTQVRFDPALVTLQVHAAGESFALFEAGAPAAFDPKKVSTALKSDYVVLDLWLSEGPTETVYTCDFGYGYVRINAEYHT